MDGTLVDSTQGVVGAWQTFRETYPDIDVHHILSCESPCRAFFYYSSYPVVVIAAHGVRTVDNLSKYCGIDDPDLLKACLPFLRSMLPVLTYGCSTE